MSKMLYFYVQSRIRSACSSNDYTEKIVNLSFFERFSSSFQTFLFWSNEVQFSVSKFLVNRLLFNSTDIILTATR